jgi:hypothetical protein
VERDKGRFGRWRGGVCSRAHGAPLPKESLNIAFALISICRMKSDAHTRRAEARYLKNVAGSCTYESAESALDTQPASNALRNQVMRACMTGPS